METAYPRTPNAERRRAAFACGSCWPDRYDQPTTGTNRRRAKRLL